ncbi:hypothetical protein TWF281_010541 [Arthrobotrys megalospora]
MPPILPISSPPNFGASYATPRRTGIVTPKAIPTAAPVANPFPDPGGTVSLPLFTDVVDFGSVVSLIVEDVPDGSVDSGSIDEVSDERVDSEGVEEVSDGTSRLPVLPGAAEVELADFVSLVVGGLGLSAALVTTTTAPAE